MSSQAVDCTPDVGSATASSSASSGAVGETPASPSTDYKPLQVQRNVTNKSGSPEATIDHNVAAAAINNALFSEPAVPFPFLCLLVSGGHNLLLLVRGVGQYIQLGSTLDDALGKLRQNGNQRGKSSWSNWTDRISTDRIAI